MTGPAAPHRLVLVGSVIADLMMGVPRLPDRGGDVLADPPSLQPGGGFNVLAAAARLGLPTALAGRVGTGPFGAMISAALAALGTEVLIPPAPGADTGLCVGFVEPDAERTFVTSPGVEAQLDAAALAGVRIEAGDALYLSGYELCYPQSGPAITGWLPSVRPGLLLLDPGPLVAEIPAALLAAVLARTTILTLNRREAALLGASGDPGQAASGLLARLPAGAAVVLRDGPRGCVVAGAGTAEPVPVPAPAVVAVDTTGAGDAHTGALVAALHDTGDLVEAARVATAAAAFAVTRAGSATGPTRAELAAFRAPG